MDLRAFILQRGTAEPKKARGGLGAEAGRTEGSGARAEPRRSPGLSSGREGEGARLRGETADREAGARSVPYRALGTSTGPRPPPPPPPGPASTSPPYFSSIAGIRSRRRCPCRGVSSCLAAAAEQRSQARHFPMAAALSGPRRPGRRRCPRLASTHAPGLGHRQFRRRGAPRRLTGVDAARPRHRPSSPHSRGSARFCACAGHTTRHPSPFLRLLPPRGYRSNLHPLSASLIDAASAHTCPAAPPTGRQEYSGFFCRGGQGLRKYTACDEIEFLLNSGS